VKHSIAMNEFALRHLKPELGYSHFKGSEGNLLELIDEHFHSHKDVGGGVVIVRVPAKNFMSPVVDIVETTHLVAKFNVRQVFEQGYIDVAARGEHKTPAKVVEVVCYSHEVLVKGNENSTQSDWEVISINARSTEEEEPPTPITMARNFLGKPGGTKQLYSAEQLAESIWYWSNRVLVEDGFKHIKIRQSNLDEVTARLEKAGIPNRMVKFDSGTHSKNGEGMCEIGVACSGATFHKLIKDIAITTFDEK
jgi:hypothetical protein